MKMKGDIQNLKRKNTIFNSFNKSNSQLKTKKKMKNLSVFK